MNQLFPYLVLGAFMFCTGVVGVIIRRNPIVIFMCIELMLNAVNLTFLAFARYHPAATTEEASLRTAMDGQMMVIFVMAVAAAEVAVGLGIIMAIFRLRNEVDIDDMNLLRG
ncbi:MAG: NADH-quinone oxidoreductase subunit NuoK [Fimbriimonadaceae bacterium]|nr:NADH-quinone oxidoreductase subunit NuoK [Fimbriimonadaceae bacterium]